MVVMPNGSGRNPGAPNTQVGIAGNHFALASAQTLPIVDPVFETGI